MSQTYLHFYFLSDPATGDSTGALKVEAEIVRDYQIIRGISDLLGKVLTAVASTGGKVRSLVISGHGGSAGFQVGSDWVTLNSGDEKLIPLAALAPFFAPDAEVVLRACHAGQARGLLQRLSSLWGGVKVSGYTGNIDVGRWWVFSYMGADGDRVSCVKDKCTSRDAAGTFQYDGDPDGEQRERNFVYACHHHI